MSIAESPLGIALLQLTAAQFWGLLTALTTVIVGAFGVGYAASNYLAKRELVLKQQEIGVVRAKLAATNSLLTAKDAVIASKEQIIASKDTLLDSSKKQLAEANANLVQHSKEQEWTAADITYLSDTLRLIFLLNRHHLVSQWEYDRRERSWWAIRGLKEELAKSIAEFDETHSNSSVVIEGGFVVRIGLWKEDFPLSHRNRIFELVEGQLFSEQDYSYVWLYLPSGSQVEVQGKQ